MMTVIVGISDDEPRKDGDREMRCAVHESAHETLAETETRANEIDDGHRTKYEMIAHDEIEGEQELGEQENDESRLRGLEIDAVVKEPSFAHQLRLTRNANQPILVGFD